MGTVYSYYHDYMYPDIKTYHWLVYVSCEDHNINGVVHMMHENPDFHKSDRFENIVKYHIAQELPDELKSLVDDITIDYVYPLGLQTQESLDKLPIGTSRNVTYAVKYTKEKVNGIITVKMCYEHEPGKKSFYEKIKSLLKDEKVIIKDISKCAD